MELSPAAFAVFFSIIALGISGASLWKSWLEPGGVTATFGPPLIGAVGKSPRTLIVTATFDNSGAHQAIVEDLAVTLLGEATGDAAHWFAQFFVDETLVFSSAGQPAIRDADRITGIWRPVRVPARSSATITVGLVQEPSEPKLSADRYAGHAQLFARSGLLRRTGWHRSEPVSFNLSDDALDSIEKGTVITQISRVTEERRRMLLESLSPEDY